MKRILALALLLLVAGWGAASDGDDLTSLSYISYMERYATVQPANDENEREAVINMPLMPGDRIDTARQARMEVQLADGSTLWLDEYTSVSLDALAASRGDSSDRTVLFLAAGDMILQVPAGTLGRERTRVDARSATVYLDRDGLYRLETTDDGGLQVEVWQGRAEAATPSGGMPIREGEVASVAAGRAEVENVALARDDDFARWVDQRRLAPDSGVEDLHVDARYRRQEAVLDGYGSWIYLDDFDLWAWQPVVTPGWAPYVAGRWYWTPVGWNWVSYEPWGWLPYHYGSWYFDLSFGWVWTWGPTWGPAWVDWVWWPGYVGWCPSGYYDLWYWRHYGGVGGRRFRPGPVRTAPRGGIRPGPRESRLPSPKLLTPPRYALDLRGDARLDRIDGRAWHVVRTSDFASPHLSRLVRPGAEVFPSVPGDVRAVVSSGPLLTASPLAVRPDTAIGRHFRTIGTGDTPDVTPLLARSRKLDPPTAARIARPTTRTELARRSLKTPAATSPAAATARVPAPRTSRAPARDVERNRFRPRTEPELRGGFTERSRPVEGVRPPVTAPSRPLVVPHGAAPPRSPRLDRRPTQEPSRGSSVRPAPRSIERAPVGSSRSPTRYRTYSRTPSRYRTYSSPLRRSAPAARAPRRPVSRYTPRSTYRPRSSFHVVPRMSAPRVRSVPRAAPRSVRPRR